MVSNGGPEEDPAVGVWKSLLEWECRAWGSAQRSAPETATGPSMPCAPKRSRWPANTNSPAATSHTHSHKKKKKKKGCRWHKETRSDCDRLAKAALQRRDLFLKMFPNVSRLSRANLMCCPPGSFWWALVYSEKEDIWGKNQLEVRKKKNPGADRNKRPERSAQYQAGYKPLQVFRLIVEEWWQRCDIAW